VKILLVNFNPVVSRLFALCTRDPHIELDEVGDTRDIAHGKRYDLVFVDDASYVESVKEFLEEQSAGKKVYISYKAGNVPGFDMTLKKPFLPSQILNIMGDVTVSEAVESEEEPVLFPLDETVDPDEETGKAAPSIFPLATEEMEGEEEEVFPENPHILDSREIEKIKGLLDMEEEETVPFEEELPEEVAEQRKVEAIKAQLIADGLEIVEEKEIVEALGSDKKPKKKKRKKEETHPFSEKEFDAVQKAFKEALFSLKPKKIKKLLKGKKIEFKLKLKDRN